jgi:hypothetical protein
MPDALSSYGSLKVSTDEDEFEFQEVNTYYLKPSPLSRSDKLKKLMLIGVPILAAVIIVGGFALLLFKSFDNLYPGPGGSVRPYPSAPEPSAPSYPVVPRGSDTHLHPASSPMHTSQSGGDPNSPTSGGGGSGGSASSSSGSSASCAGHKQCNELELIGDCCPTDQGVMLGCC